MIVMSIMRRTLIIAVWALVGIGGVGQWGMAGEDPVVVSDREAALEQKVKDLEERIAWLEANIVPREELADQSEAVADMVLEHDSLTKSLKRDVDDIRLLCGYLSTGLSANKSDSSYWYFGAESIESRVRALESALGMEQRYYAPTIFNSDKNLPRIKAIEDKIRSIESREDSILLLKNDLESLKQDIEYIKRY